MTPPPRGGPAAARAFLLATGSLLLGTLLAGCGSSSPTTAAPTAPAQTATAPATASPPATSGPAEASGGSIKIKDFGFGAPLTVAPGATVEVENEDSVRHNVSGSAFHTDLLGQGQYARFTAPSQPGTYSFTCSVHPQMHGELIVRAGAGASRPARTRVPGTAAPDRGWRPWQETGPTRGSAGHSGGWPLPWRTAQRAAGRAGQPAAWWAAWWNDGMRPDDIAPLLHGARESTARFLLGLDALAGQDVARPSLLPGWTVGHVLTHIARNADGMTRTLGGALRGEPTPMYPDGARGREADIEAGAGRPLPAQADDLRASAQRLDDAWRAMTAESWDRESVTRAGPVPAWRTVVGRWVEVELHWVDLDLGYRPDRWPEEFTGWLLRIVTGSSLAGRVAGGLRLVNADTGQEWSVGDGPRTMVRGPGWALACWLAGRAAPAEHALEVAGGAGLPALGRWL